MPRMRVFAGPNGSGKSVLKPYLPPALLGVFPIFDNSTDSADRKLAWVAEITERRTLELKTNRIPPWLRRAVLEKINTGS